MNKKMILFYLLMSQLTDEYIYENEEGSLDATTLFYLRNRKNIKVPKILNKGRLKTIESTTFSSKQVEKAIIPDGVEVIN